MKQPTPHPSKIEDDLESPNDTWGRNNKVKTNLLVYFQTGYHLTSRFLKIHLILSCIFRVLTATA